MSAKVESFQNPLLFKKIKLISNSQRFRILELTQDKELNISELSTKLKLAYNKCADYVRMLEQSGLIQKTREGKEAQIKSKVKFASTIVEFKN